MSVIECEELKSWFNRKSRFYLLHCTRHKMQVCDRIPGACDFALEDVFSLQDLVHALARLGIRKDGNWVVCYQTAGLDVACEVWWLLQALGRDNSAVLSGGLSEWRRLNYPTSIEVPQPSPVLPGYDGGYEQLPQRYKLESEIQEMQRLPGFALQVIDTQGGYIRSVPFDPLQGVLPGGKLASREVMKEIFDRCGIDLAEGTASIVIGPLASVALLELAAVGKRNIAVGLVDRSLEEPHEQAALEINNEDFYSVLEANLPPSQFLSIVETIYYDALGGGSRRCSNAQLSETRLRGVHSKGISYSSESYSRLSNIKPRVSMDADAPVQNQEKGRKMGTEDRCAHCCIL